MRTWQISWGGLTVAGVGAVVVRESGVPTWFGPEDSRLFGVVHGPRDGTARAGVVVCPPLGRQHLDTYRGLKLLAQQLAGADFAVLRFDYLGTGDSTGEQCGDGAPEDYLQSIRTAVQYLRDSGVSKVALVGLRLGALLAATAAPTIPALAGVVLWDPVADGRRYLREQQMLYQVTVGAAESSDPDGETGVVPILGITLSTAAADALGALRMPTTLGTVPVLALIRPERIDERRMADLLATDTCQAREVLGQPEFVEPPSVAVEVPLPTLEVIVNWLDERLPPRGGLFRPAIAEDAVVGELPDGRKVLERLTELGTVRLFAIRTVLSGAADDGPTLLLHNTACEHRVGSGRIWSEVAREVARFGVAVVRYDRRGVGDTGVATDAYAWVHGAEARDDVTAAVAALGVPPDRLMMTGICSGAWNSAYAALQYGAKSVVLLNILLYSLRRVDGAPERIGQITDTLVGQQSGRGSRAGEVIKQALRDWLPYRGWLLLGRLGYTQAPEVLFTALGKRGIPTEVVLSPSDVKWYDGHRGPAGAKRLSRRGWAPRLTLAGQGDHAVLHRGLQNFIRAYLADAVRREFAGQLALPVVSEGRE